MTISDRVRVKNVHMLSDRHYRLNEVEFDYRRAQRRMADAEAGSFRPRSTAATLLPYNVASRTVVLTRQFRLPAYLAGHDDLLIEAAAGMLDDETPEKRIRAEAEEEIGYRLRDVRKIFEAFMSPGSVTEKLHFFVAEYDPSMRVGSGGGLAEEGEDIEVLELPIDYALAMIPTAASWMRKPSCCCNTPRCIFLGEEFVGWARSDTRAHHRSRSRLR